MNSLLITAVSPRYRHRLPQLILVPPQPQHIPEHHVIQINKSRTDISLKFQNGTMTVSNATRTSFEATTDYPQSYVLINNTLPEMANKNLSFKVDGANYANSTADSNGFVSINYTGTWSQNTFEWALIPDGNTNFTDLIQIALHFGEVTAAPYPRYDVNTDGVVDVYDIIAVSSNI